MIECLPKSWDEVTLEQYLKQIHNLPVDEPVTDTGDLDTSLAIISILTDIPICDLEGIKLNEILPMVERISFIYQEPVQAKINYKCKAIEDIGYDDFITWMQLKDDPFNNTDKLLPIFFPELKQVDVKQLPITIINGCFFLLMKNLRKYLKRSARSLSLKIIRLILKEKIQKIFK